MAAKGKVQNDFQAHENTYVGFLNLLKYGTIASVIVAFVVIFLIAN